MNTSVQSYEAKQAVRAQEAQKLRAQYPYLVPANCGKPSNVVAAQNIRIELKRAFPAVKFSVRTKRFSMGDDINVSWVDGPTTKQVDDIIQKYKSGSFNGMEDIYEYSRSVWTDAFGDSKYIFGNRSLSDAFVASVIESLKARFNTIDGQAAPTVEQYRQGQIWNSPWGRVLNVELSSTEGK